MDNGTCSSTVISEIILSEKIHVEMMSVTWSLLANDSAHLVSKVEFVFVQRDSKLSDSQI